MSRTLYTVETSITGGADIVVDRAEFSRLAELGLIDQLLSVSADPSEVIASPSPPTAPAVGTVWINNTV